MTAANQIVYVAITPQHTKTYQESPDPSIPVHDTESDPAVIGCVLLVRHNYNISGASLAEPDFPCESLAP